MSFSRDSAILVWRRAEDSEIGIALVLKDPSQSRLRQLVNSLYDARKFLADPDLAGFTVSLPKGGKEVWIVRNGIDLNEDRRELPPGMEVE